MTACTLKTSHHCQLPQKGYSSACWSWFLGIPIWSLSDFIFCLTLHMKWGTANVVRGSQGSPLINVNVRGVRCNYWSLLLSRYFHSSIWQYLTSLYLLLFAVRAVSLWASYLSQENNACKEFNRSIWSRSLILVTFLARGILSATCDVCWDRISTGTGEVYHWQMHKDRILILTPVVLM